ncbi:hypothetical protein [Mycobacterium deserti]|uniref:Peptide zinc metalloprotease protein n=1 Tax=Mycobacterium deserti TaxID=2978347 RepID=A0ABT2MHW2_9MYCO|nr:hypothetical protein [Mycobacterium deserti]MCT7661807.1 hypothetical protein [Mycobacterium deserti]
MTTTTEGSGAAQAVLHRAEGVEMIGEMAGSGYRVPPSLVRRADGQTIQLTPLLYATLREVDGHRTAAEVADAVSESTDRAVSEDNVAHFVEEQLRPLGLMVRADGSEPVLKKRNPLLGLRFRYAVTDPDRTKKLTDPFRFLFRPVVVAVLLAAFAVVCWWVFFHKGLAAAAYDAFERPGLLILVFLVTIVSAGFHEFGHAAAARYGGATPGVMGVGLYLVWPAFYTDVTDSYRLGRRGRLRTDLGGLYFNAVVAVAITALWLGLRYDALLLIVATQIIQMLRQLAPLVRFDGYHVLADLTGVPDLYGRIKPILLGMLPWRWRDPEPRMLKPWARIVVTVWVAVVVPLLIAMLALAVVTLPRLLGTAWASLHRQQDVLATAWADGDLIQATARVLAIIAIIIPVAGVIYLLIRFARQSILTIRRATADKPLKRAAAAVFGVAVLCGIGYAWWPDEGTYRPIEASERGALGDIVFALGLREMPDSTRTADAATRPVAATRTLAAGQQGTVWALWDNGTATPTVNSPQLAVILVPKTPSAAVANGGGGGGVYAPTTAADQGWVFPFDRPLAPEDGDNQALAVNTTDGTVEYDVAVAMVWQTDEDYALNVNEAHAYASCNDCAAVAVAYQVVFVIDEDDSNDNVAVPQNLAGALNYDCVNCLTYAVAQQLFVTLDEPLSPEAKAELDEVWEEVGLYAAKVQAGEIKDLDTIAPTLEGYTTRIKEIVEKDQPGTFPTTQTSTAQPTTTAPPTAVTPSATTVAPPSSSAPEPTSAADATAPPESTSTDTTAGSTASVNPTATSEPTTGNTTEGATTGESTTDSTTGGTDTGGTTSDGSTSDGSDTAS